MGKKGGPRAKEVLDVIKTMGNITTREIAELLGITHQKINSAIYGPLSRGEVVRKKIPSPAGRAGPATEWSYSLGNGSTPGDKFAQPKASTNPVKATVPKPPAPEPVEAGNREVELYKQVQDLLAWKAWAVRQYPDLGVKPVVLEARKLFAARLDKTAAEAVLNGNKDSSPAMLALIDALEIAA